MTPITSTNPHSGASYDYHFNMYYHYLNHDTAKAEYHRHMAELLAEAG